MRKGRRKWQDKVRVKGSPYIINLELEKKRYIFQISLYFNYISPLTESVAEMKAHLNKTNRGHRLPSSPSLLLRSHGARLQRGGVGHPMKLWEAYKDRSKKIQ